MRNPATGRFESSRARSMRIYWRDVKEIAKRREVDLKKARSVYTAVITKRDIKRSEISRKSIVSAAVRYRRPRPRPEPVERFREFEAPPESYSWDVGPEPPPPAAMEPVVIFAAPPGDDRPVFALSDLKHLFEAGLKEARDAGLPGTVHFSIREKRTEVDGRVISDAQMLTMEYNPNWNAEEFLHEFYLLIKQQYYETEDGHPTSPTTGLYLVSAISM